MEDNLVATAALNGITRQPATSGYSYRDTSRNEHDPHHHHVRWDAG